jgi:hypothetical protein
LFLEANAGFREIMPVSRAPGNGAGEDALEKSEAASPVFFCAEGMQ